MNQRTVKDGAVWPRVLPVVVHSLPRSTLIPGATQVIDTMTEPQKFASYEEFFQFYLKQHSDPRNRTLHAIGTTFGVTVVVAALLLGHPWYALLFFPIGYGFAWTGHFVLEKNKPATFGHPLWSFISDFRMIGLMFTRRLEARMQPKRP